MSNNRTLADRSFASLPLQIKSTATTRADGRVHSFCGLVLTNEADKTSNKGYGQTSEERNTCANEDSESTKVHAAYKSSNLQVSYDKLEFPVKQCRFCGATMWVEEKTCAASESNLSYSICCQEGKVGLPKLQHAPEPLRTLLHGDTKEAATFRQKIRIYNSMFSFTSFGGQIDEHINRSRGPYTFRMSGQNYHRFGTLMPEAGNPPQYSQLYFYDTENEVQNRMGCMNLDSSDVNISVVQQLQHMLDENNSVAKAFRMARDWVHNHNSHEVTLKLIGERQNMRRQYNLPTVSEVAALIIGDFGQSTGPRDVYVQTKAGGHKRISELHPLYMALQYPLLFPRGEDGFHEKIPYARNTGRRKTERAFVTMKEYYCYRIQQRKDEADTLIWSGRLFHQFLVDAYTAVEEQRLRWIRFNQKQLRADLYNNICDAVTKGDVEATAIGKRIVLPASFTGGPRYMVQNYQDAMALCRAFGNPSLFITFTANPNWPEVSEMLSELKGQNSNDRPDLMTRLFKLKLGQLMQDLKKNEIFGPTNAAVYTIEFQKRGLPHAHILLWLKEGGAAKSGKDIDEIISAEIPYKDSDPEAYKKVCNHMIHGPCGDDRKKAPCMSNGKCTKHFPKPFYAETTLDEEGYPVYMRRDDGVRVKKGKTILDNRYVVPYNRYLLLKYDAHINVEWCNRSRAIKYLFKYISKGPDRATVEFLHGEGSSNPGGQPRRTIVDEIRYYLECRFLSACEAVWRLLGFDIHYSRPAVIRLLFHLPDQQFVTLEDRESLLELLRREELTKTMLTEWFTLNISDPEAREYHYAELPGKYVWNAKERVWKKRKLQKPIGRIVYTHPAAGERYYLRMLLNVVKGPRSFEDIRTVNGQVFGTFREACYARGMLKEDSEWTDAIQEAQLWATGIQLRDLFVTILLFCDVSSPKQLWESNWEALSEDILYKKRKQHKFPNLELSENQLKNYCLLEIQEILTKNGKSLSDFPEMPMPDKSLLTNMDNRLIQEELSYNTSEMAVLLSTLHKQLNAEQIAIYNKVINAVEQKTGEFFFVYGAGGTGKTYLYKTIMARLRSEQRIVLAVASSGISALLLQGGRTAHSRFLIPIELFEHSTCGITQNSHLARLMHEVELIIWDEAPMTQRQAFEALNRTLQDILGAKCAANRERLFGGITVLLGGDFRQILPVITKGKRQEIVQASITNSPLWNHCQVLKLTQSMRVNERTKDGSLDEKKQEFNRWILQVGDGNAPAIAIGDEGEPTWIEIPKQFLVETQANPIQQLIDEVFIDFRQNKTDATYLQERAILTPLNEDADKINDHMFASLDGDVKEYRSSDEICMASTDVAEQEHMYPTEFLNSLDFPGMPPHNLRLKEGLPVMLLRNVNPTQGLCNGTRLIITRLGNWVVEAEIVIGAFLGKKVIIPRITLSSTKTKWPFVMKRRQFPIKPCFAMTINKSQGQSLRIVGLYLPRPVFCHGQLYVAISRVTDPNGLKIIMRRDATDPKNHTKNIVFKEAFNNLETQRQVNSETTTAGTSDASLNLGSNV